MKKGKLTQAQSTLRRMAGNIAAGFTGRYSVNELEGNKGKQKLIAEVSADIARKIVKELEG